MNPNDRDIRDEIAENERWLAGFETPRASRELLDSIKQSVRAELAQQRQRRGRRRWSAWQGAAASAAMIFLAAGVGWFSTKGEPDDQDTRVARMDAEEIAQSLEEMWVGDDYSDWGSTSGDAWTVSATALYDDLEAAMPDYDSSNGDDTGALAPAGIDGRRAEEIG